jgi:hypothetical protein
VIHEMIHSMSKSLLSLAFGLILKQWHIWGIYVRSSTIIVNKTKYPVKILRACELRIGSDPLTTRLIVSVEPLLISSNWHVVL